MLSSRAVEAVDEPESSEPEAQKPSDLELAVEPLSIGDSS